MNGLEVYRVFAVYYETFNCSDPATYLYNTADDCGNSSLSCTNLFSPQDQEQILSAEYLYSCEPVSATSLCKVQFPDLISKAVTVPDRVGSEKDAFSFLEEFSEHLDTTCQNVLSLAACSYIHPPCDKNGRRIAREPKCWACALQSHSN
jgi:hypothetical protein